MEDSCKLQSDLYKRSKDTAGARYSEEVHVGLPIANIFEGLGRTPAFFNRYKELKLKIRKEQIGDDLSLLNDHKSLQKKIKNSNAHARNVFDEISKIPEDALNAIDLKKALSSAKKFGNLYYEYIADLRQIYDQEVKSNTSQPSSNSQHTFTQHEKIGFLLTRLENLSTAIQEVAELIESDSTRAAQCRFLWINGDAGSGKTHLFCDVAKRRIAAGLPTLIFMGWRISRY